MRPITLVILATICIVIASSRGTWRHVKSQPKPAPKSVIVKVDNPQEHKTPGVLYSHWTHARLGIDEETAKQIALEDAQRDLGVWLRSRNIKWRPAPGYVEQLVRDKSVGKESTSDGDAPTVKLLV